MTASVIIQLKDKKYQTVDQDETDSDQGQIAAADFICYRNDYHKWFSLCALDFSDRTSRLN